MRVNNVGHPFLGEVVSSKESKDSSCSHIIQGIPGEATNSYLLLCTCYIELYGHVHYCFVCAQILEWGNSKNELYMNQFETPPGSFGECVANYHNR